MNREMDEAAIQRVVTFSKHLKKNADILLEKSGIVSLDTWTLYEIEEAFSLIFEVEKYTNFHVLPQNNRQHPAIPHIQFLYDILQKVKKLRILTKPYKILPLEQQINLKCFRNLNWLELDSIPINQLKGLQNLRPVLKSLIVQRVCSQIGEILLECGADKSTEYAWQNLQVAIFSRNCLTRLDSSLRLLPAIKFLNLSYCHLVDVSALFHLPTISTLNLSYNEIITIPTFSDHACNSLVSLDLSYNMIIDLEGLDLFTNLEECDLRGNVITVDQSLTYLSTLPHLRCLRMTSNPIACSINYRFKVLRSLNPATKYCYQLLLDDHPVVSTERREIGASSPPVQPDRTPNKMLQSRFERITRFVQRGIQQVVGAGWSQGAAAAAVQVAQPEEKQGNEVAPVKASTRRSRRKNTVRHVSISDQDDSFQYVSQTLASSLTSSCMVSPSGSPCNDPLSTINVGTEGQGSSMFYLPNESNLSNEDPDMSTLTAAPSRSDKLLEEILTSHSRGREGAAPLSPSNADDFTLNTSTLDSSVVSSEGSSSFHHVEERGGRYSPLQTDDDDLEPDRGRYMVMARGEHPLQDTTTKVDFDGLFLSFSNYFYKEMNGLNRVTLVKLNISSLQGMEVLSTNPYKVQLNFSHTHPDLCSRVFRLEDDDFQRLKRLAEPIIARNQTEDEAATPPPCKKCGLPFYGTMAKFSILKSRKLYCKQCGNKKRKPSPPSSGAESGPGWAVTPFATGEPEGEAATSKLPTSGESCEGRLSGRDQRHRREKSLGLSSDSSESVSVCSSEVSHRKGGSDPDLVSNLSLSSIEVLSEHHGGADSGESRLGSGLGFEPPVGAAFNSDARTPPEDMGPHEAVLKEDLKLAAKEPTAMQESSSSGSMTGSVCTAVDRLSSGPGTPLKLGRGDLSGGKGHNRHEHTPGLDVDTSLLCSVSTEGDHCFSSSAKSTETVCDVSSPSLRDIFSSMVRTDPARNGVIFGDPSNHVPVGPWAKALRNSFTGYSCEGDEESGDGGETNPVTFSFEDFSAIDHRLKLFCEVFLFSEHQETIRGVVEAVVIVEDGEAFQGLLVLSNRKAYVLRIKGTEKAMPQDWLCVETCCFLEEIPSVHTLLQKQGLLIQMASVKVLVCLAETQRTDAVLFFLMECLDQFGVHPRVEDGSAALQSEAVRRQVIATKVFREADTAIHHFQIVTKMHSNGTTSDHFLVVTSKNVILFEGDLSWLFPLDSTQELDLNSNSRDLVVSAYIPIDDVTQIDMFSARHLRFEFYHDKWKPFKTPWDLYVASEWAGGNLVLTFQPLWVKKFRVTLDVMCYSEDLLVVRELLKETRFSAYIK